MAKRRISQAANDNEARGGRQIVNTLPTELPLMEVELLLLETYGTHIIRALAPKAANDNHRETQGQD